MSGQELNTEIIEVRDLASHDDFVSSLAFSPDGDLLVSTGADGSATIHRSGGPFSSIKAHEGYVSKVAFSLTSSLFATGGIDGWIRVWDEGGDLVVERHASGWVHDLAWRPGGDEVAAAIGRRVVRVIATGMNAPIHDPLGTQVTCLGWSGDGRRLLAGTYGGIHVFQGANRPTQHFAWKGALVTLAVSPDDSWVASGNQDATMHCWKLWSGADLQMSGYQGKIQHVSWDRSGRSLALADSGEISCWNFAGRGPKGTRPITLSGHVRSIAGMGFSPARDNFLASAGRDGSLCLWCPQKSGRSLLSKHVFDDELSALSWCPDGTKIALGSASGKVRVVHLGGVDS